LPLFFIRLLDHWHWTRVRTDLGGSLGPANWQAAEGCHAGPLPLEVHPQHSLGRKMIKMEGKTLLALDVPLGGGGRPHAYFRLGNMLKKMYHMALPEIPSDRQCNDSYNG